MEIAILVAIVVGLTEVIKKTGMPTKYLPFVALVIGVLLGYGTDGTDGILNGIIMGLVASGSYDVGKFAVKRIKKVREINIC